MTQGSEKRSRTSHLTFRLTPAERATIDADAARAGLTSGSYARKLMLGAVPPRQSRRPPIERKELARLLGELGRIGNNLNQLAHAKNSGQQVPGHRLAEALDGLRDMRDAILKALGREP